MERRVTLREIAAAAGVHHTTAARALKNDPRVQPETLSRIKKLAEQMGYTPDPMLSALNAYRQAKRVPQYHGTVAWVTNFPTRGGWRATWGQQTSCYDLYYRGAADQLARHGYKLEEFWLHEPNMTARRASQVLTHRGIRGLLLCPLPLSRGHLSLAWEKFSAVSFGYSLQRPRLHLFSAAHFQAVITCLRQLRVRSYQRIGMVISHSMDSRMNNLYTAAYRSVVPILRRAEAIPIYVYRDGRDAAHPDSQKRLEDAFQKWCKSYQPEAIVTTSPFAACSWLERGGYRVPEEVALVCPALQENEPRFAGVVEGSREIGRGAADFLVGMMHRGEQGVPRVPQRVLLEGSWFEGSTAHKRPRNLALSSFAAAQTS